MYTRFSVHGNLQPANLLLHKDLSSKSVVVKLYDFGHQSKRSDKNFYFNKSPLDHVFAAPEYCTDNGGDEIFQVRNW